MFHCSKAGSAEIELSCMRYAAFGRGNDVSIRTARILIKTAAPGMVSTSASPTALNDSNCCMTSQSTCGNPHINFPHTIQSPRREDIDSSGSRSRTSHAAPELNNLTSNSYSVNQQFLCLYEPLLYDKLQKIEPPR